ncbi:hypothetical protein GCM10028868_05680 [Virgibacillus kimchii]
MKCKGHMACSVACLEWCTRGLEFQIINRVATGYYFYLYEIVAAKEARNRLKAVEEIS